MSFLETPQGFSLRFVDRGDGPQTILLVHGWKCSHRLWDTTILALQDRFRVVAFDLRGMGESDKPKSNYDFEELSSDLGFVIRALRLSNITLVGWSMGCSVSLEYLRRDGTGVAKLVLVAGPITRAVDFPGSMDPDHLRQVLADVATTWPTQERSFISEYFVDPNPEFVGWMLSIALQTPPYVALRAAEHQNHLDFREFLATLSLPTLAIYGRHDPHCPPAVAEFIERQAPNRECAIFEQSLHLPFIEEPERFVRVLADFASRP
jgi:non-heme chloroperoxidase